MKADIYSGDNPRSDDLGTFNPLFPKGNYFGVLGTTGPGPINFIDVHPDLELSIPHKLLLSAGWIFQWRESLEDGVYAVPGFLITAANGSLARYVGNRPSTQLRWQADRHLWFQADYGIFLPVDFSSKQDLVATLITGRYEPNTSSECVRGKRAWVVNQLKIGSNRNGPIREQEQPRGYGKIGLRALGAEGLSFGIT